MSNLSEYLIRKKSIKKGDKQINVTFGIVGHVKNRTHSKCMICGSKIPKGRHYTCSDVCQRKLKNMRNDTNGRVLSI